jgi:hypothetical protein
MLNRADLYGSLDAGQPPFFGRRQAIGPPLATDAALRSEGFCFIRDELGLDAMLCQCITQLEEATLFWSHYPNTTLHIGPATGRAPADVARVRHLQTAVQYTLVSAGHHPSLHHGNAELHSTEDALHELLRVVLIIFTLSVFNERPESTSVGLTIAARFCDILTGITDAAMGCGSAAPTPPSPPGSSATRGPTLLSMLPVDFFLWAVFLALDVVMATGAASNGEDVWEKLWDIFLILSDTSEGGADRAQCPGRFKRRMSRYLWVPQIHDGRLDSLWTRLESRKRWLPQGTVGEDAGGL